jgi:hypothetical protein
MEEVMSQNPDQEKPDFSYLNVKPCHQAVPILVALGGGILFMTVIWIFFGR